MRKVLFILLAMLMVVAVEAKKKTITHCVVTVYHPVRSQTDSSPLVTSDGSKINLHKLKRGEIKWCAISRDLLWMFPKGKPKRILIEGLGIYEVRDTMNKRFDHRVDILVHPTNRKMMNKKLKITIL